MPISAPLPAGTTLLVRGACVLLPEADWDDPPVAALAIGGDRIRGVAPAFAPTEGAAPPEALEAPGLLVLPGSVFAHDHSHDVLAKGTLEEVPLEQWRLYALPAQYPPRSREEVRARTLRGAPE
jgi:guanine deaminase